MMSRALLTCGLIIGTAMAAGAQLPTFSAREESVRVDVLVTEGGRIVRDVRASDFEIRDEGVPQQVELASFEQLPVSVVVALDASQSVTGEPIEQLRRGGRALLDALRPDDRAAIVTFDDRASLRARPTSDLPALHAALDGIRPAGVGDSGGTAVIDATYMAMIVSETAGYRPLVITFSDGVDTGSWLTTEGVLGAARSLNVVVYGVTANGSGDRTFLREVTKLTGGQLLEADSGRAVQASFTRGLEEFRNRYVLSYSPQGVRSRGWHRLDVRVKGRRSSVTARAGYVAGP